MGIYGNLEALVGLRRKKYFSSCISRIISLACKGSLPPFLQVLQEDMFQPCESLVILGGVWFDEMISFPDMFSQ